MIPAALKKEIEDLRSQGKTDDEIKLDLLKVGWPKTTVDGAFETFSPPDLIIPTSLQPTTIIQNKDNPETDKQKNSGKGNYFQNILSGQKKFRVFIIGLLIGLLTTVYPSYQVIKFGLPFVKNLEQKVMTIVDEVFPDELEITIENGTASTNVTEPYHLTISQSTLENFISFDEKHGQQPVSKIRILTLNTSGNIEDFEENQTMAMLTSQNLIYYGDEGIQISSLSGMPDMKINKQFIRDKISEFNKDQQLIKLLKTLIYLTPLLIILGVSILFILEVSFGAFVIWIINKILKTNLGFGKLYALTGALVALPFLFLTNIRLLPFLQPYYLWLSTAVDVVVISIGYVLLTEYNNSQNKE